MSLLLYDSHTSANLSRCPAAVGTASLKQRPPHPQLPADYSPAGPERLGKVLPPQLLTPSATETSSAQPSALCRGDPETAQDQSCVDAVWDLV